MITESELATLEQNHFLLDGSCILPKPENGEVGWWSEKISSASGVFETPQVLEFHFTDDHASMGFMILFDDKANEYATDFIIQVFDQSGDVQTGKEYK